MRRAYRHPRTDGLPRARYPDRYHPHNERQAFEKERSELLAQIAALQAELADTAPTSKARQERLDWQTPNARKRLAEVEGRLATMLAVIVRGKNQRTTQSMSFFWAPDTVNPRGPKGK